jgi:LDH2 family malate/lactate/ureidoglycolate dehydrogenase
MSEIRRYPERALRSYAEGILVSVGARPRHAHVVADTLVEADRRGVSTHGVVRLASYCANIEQGEIDVHAEPQVEREDGPTALVDGRRAFGAVTSTFAMDLAAAKAETHGIGAVAARRCTHFGTAAYYSLRAARRGLVGLAATNTPGVMAPVGGAEARLGNNPFSVAAPMPDGRGSFVLDMALSMVARGRIKLAEMNGAEIPSGWAIDPDGRSTTDPSRALAGALLPVGGHKGYALALAVEILTAVLAGADLSPELRNTSMTGVPKGRENAKAGNVGSFYLAIDPDRFAGRETFLDGIGRLMDGMIGTPRAVDTNEVLIPGDIEARSAATAATEGVGLDEATVRTLEELGQRRGIDFPAPVGDRAGA